MRYLLMLAAAASLAACHNRSEDETGAAPDRGDTTAVTATDTTAMPTDSTMGQTPGATDTSFVQQDTTAAPTSTDTTAAPTGDTTGATPTDTSSSSATPSDSSSMGTWARTAATCLRPPTARSSSPNRSCFTAAPVIGAAFLCRTSRTAAIPM